ncbi:MAG: hypothetical protein MHM6MM_000177 [Cercozoa sp. M6MM]
MTASMSTGVIPASAWLYIDNIDVTCSEQALREFLGQYGEMRSCSLNLHGRRPYGFAQMASELDAARCVRHLHDATWGVRKVKVLPRSNKPDGSQGPAYATRVLVRQLPKSEGTSKEALEQRVRRAFERFGGLEQVMMVPRELGSTDAVAEAVATAMTEGTPVPRPVPTGSSVSPAQASAQAQESYTPQPTAGYEAVLRFQSPAQAAAAIEEQSGRPLPPDSAAAAAAAVPAAAAPAAADDAKQEDKQETQAETQQEAPVKVKFLAASRSGLDTYRSSQSSTSMLPPGVRPHDLFGIYVAQFPLHWTPDDLVALFRDQNCVNAKVLTKPGAAPNRGMGFAHFAHLHEAQAAQRFFDGKCPHDAVVPIMVRMANRKRPPVQPYGASPYGAAPGGYGPQYNQYGARPYGQSAGYGQQQPYGQPSGYGQYPQSAYSAPPPTQAHQPPQHAQYGAYPSASHAPAPHHAASHAPAPHHAAPHAHAAPHHPAPHHAASHPPAPHASHAHASHAHASHPRGTPPQY